MVKRHDQCGIHGVAVTGDDIINIQNIIIEPTAQVIFRRNDEEEYNDGIYDQGTVICCCCGALQELEDLDFIFVFDKWEPLTHTSGSDYITMETLEQIMVN